MTKDELIKTIANCERAVSLFRWLDLSCKGELTEDHINRFDKSAELEWKADSLRDVLKDINKAMPSELASVSTKELINADEAIKKDAKRLLEGYSFFDTDEQGEPISPSVKMCRFFHSYSADESERVRETKDWLHRVWSDLSALITNFDTYLNESQARNKAPKEHHWDISKELVEELKKVAEGKTIKKDKLRAIKKHLLSKMIFLPKYKDFCTIFPDLIGERDYRNVLKESDLNIVKHEKFR